MEMSGERTSRNSVEAIGQMRGAVEQVGYCPDCHAAIERAARECPACGRVGPFGAAEVEELVQACWLQG